MYVCMYEYVCTGDLQKDRQLRFRFICSFRAREEKSFTFECDTRENRDLCFEGLRDFIEVARPQVAVEQLGVGLAPQVKPKKPRELKIGEDDEMMKAYAKMLRRKR